jgi:ribonuclease HII
MPPDFSFERRLVGVVCGIDEAGRGPLAGPVVAAAVVLPIALPALLETHLDDSKMLSKVRRHMLFDIIAEVARVGVGAASVDEIDHLNILQATLLAMRRAFDSLGTSGVVNAALVDGNQPPALPCPVHCLVRGDSRSFSIAAASVMAKVSRDRVIDRLAAQHPHYGWERNAGYGTAEHLAALDRWGPTVHHRRSFAPVTRRLHFGSTAAPNEPR